AESRRAIRGLGRRWSERLDPKLVGLIRTSLHSRKSLHSVAACLRQRIRHQRSIQWFRPNARGTRHHRLSSRARPDRQRARVLLGRALCQARRHALRDRDAVNELATMRALAAPTCAKTLPAKPTPPARNDHFDPAGTPATGVCRCSVTRFQYAEDAFG